MRRLHNGRVPAPRRLAVSGVEGVTLNHRRRFGASLKKAERAEHLTNNAAARLVICPECLAPAGQNCVASTGRTCDTQHQSRVRIGRRHAYAAQEQADRWAGSCQH